MPKLYFPDKKKFISYNKHKFKENKAPYIIFHHGLMSSMQSSKAIAIEQYCINKKINYIKFDNLGHGESYGDFTEQTISSWLEGLNLVIDKLVEKEFLLIGSSMGAWISLLAAKQKYDIMKGLVLLSAAPDFTENLIWQKMSEQQQQELFEKNIINFQGADKDCNYVYPISKSLIEDGRKYLLLNKNNININCPIHLIHGMNDIDVPHQISMQLAEKISHDKITIKLIKDANHSLSRNYDLNIVFNSIEEIISS